MKSKILSLAIVFALIGSSVSYAGSAENLAKYGVIQPSDNGYNEQAQMTRAEFLVVLSKLYGIKDIKVYEYKNQFKDVNASDWYAPYVQFALDQKITAGLSTTAFGPNATLTYEQASIFMIRALGHDTNFDNALNKAFDLKLLEGITVKLSTPISRGEVFTLAENVLNQPYNGDASSLKNKLGLLHGQKYRNQSQMSTFGFTSVRAISDSVIELRFASAPEYLLAEEVALSDPENTIKATTKIDDKTYLVQLTKSFTKDLSVTIGNKRDVKPMVKDTGKFIFIANSSMARTNTSLILQFNKPVDYTVLSQLSKFKFDNDLTATRVNYYIDEKGLYDYGKLEVTTTPQIDGKMYSLELKSLTDLTGLTLLPRASGGEFQFGGVKSDSTAPVVDRAYTKTNKDVYLQFRDETGLDLSSATLPQNYSIKTSDKGEILNVTSVTALPDRFGIIKELKLNTDLMTGNTGYIIEVKNVKDLQGNMISKEANFRTSLASRARDSERPSVIDYLNMSSNKIKLVFNEEISKSTAENIENYRFDQDIKVLKAQLNEVDNKTVYLETTDQPTGKNYQLYISYIEDLFGNMMPKNDGKAYFFGNGGNQVKPKAVTVEAQLYGGRAAVVVSYSKDMDMATVLDKNNYVFSKLGTALYVEKINEQQVKVYTEDQIKYEKYDLTITNVLDQTDIGLNGGSQTIGFYGVSL